MLTLNVGLITRMELESEEDGSLWLTISGSKQPTDVYRFPLNVEQLRDWCEDAAFVLEGFCKLCCAAQDEGEGELCARCQEAFDRKQQPEPHEAGTAG
jgi:hypothetical protein